LFPRLQAQEPVPASNPNPKAAIDGDVVNAATNAPIPGARVKVEQYPDEPLYTRADDQGHFQFAGLKPGVYRLHVESPGFLASDYNPVNLMIPRAGAALRSVVSSSSGLPAATAPRSTDPDGTLRARVTVPLTAQVVIAGKVTDPYGLPMAECQVELLAPRPARPGGAAIPAGPGDNPEVAHRGQADVDDRGEFRFFGLEPGKYYMVATKTGTRSWDADYRITYYPGAIALASAKPLELAAGQQVRADIQIVRQGGVRVAGRILGVRSEGAAPDSALYTNVMLVPENNPLLNANGPSASGRDEFELKSVLPGKYRLTAATYRSSTNWTGGMPKAEFGLMRDIEVGDNDMLGVDLTLQPLHDLAGIVTFHEGCKPFPIEIQVSNTGPIFGEAAKARPGPDGKFVLSGIGPGISRVNIMDPSYLGMAVPIESIRLGERDVQKNGIEVPYTGNETLSVSVKCNPARGIR
jgi:hypothetical protein